MITPEPIIGRGMIKIDRALYRDLFESLDIKLTDVQGELQQRGIFESVHKILLLPEDYTILGIYYAPWWIQSWVIVVEHPSLPLPLEGALLPTLSLMYQRQEDKSTVLLRIDIEGVKS